MFKVTVYPIDKVTSIAYIWIADEWIIIIIIITLIKRLPQKVLGCGFHRTITSDPTNQLFSAIYKRDSFILHQGKKNIQFYQMYSPAVLQKTF